MKRIQSEPMKRVVKEAKCCELCGSSRTLEAHHIIPLVCGGTDTIDNLIAICGRCHSILTPRKILQNIGIENTKCRDQLNRIYDSFYNEIGRSLEEGTLIDEFDVFDKVIFAEKERLDRLDRRYNRA